MKDLSQRAGFARILGLALVATTVALAPSITAFATNCPNMPAATMVEPEACGGNSHGGCFNGTGFTPITIGTVVAGTLHSRSGTGDRDNYTFTSVEPMQVTVRVFSEAPVRVSLTDDLESCFENVWATASSQSPACQTSVTACLSAGEQQITLRLTNLNTTVVCGSSASSYRLQLTAVPATCTPFGETCGAVGNDSALSTSTWDPFGTNITCLDGNQNLNGSTYYKWFDGMEQGTLKCVEMAMGNTGAPTPVTFQLVRDRNGGPPSGAFDEFEILAQASIVISKCNFVTTRWVLEEQLCLDGLLGDLMVVAICPPMTSGGQILPRSTPVGVVESTPTYFSGPACGVFAPANADNLVSGVSVAWPARLRGTLSAPCPATCPADLDGNGDVGAADLSLVLASWGNPKSAADLDGDGDVGAADLSLLLAA